MKRIPAVTFLVLASLVLQPAAGWAIVPVNGPAPTITPVTINASAGNQTNPHVSGEWAAYSDGTSIRYYNFATDLDSLIAGSTNDLLSDISGTKIVFTRNFGTHFGIMVFDAATGAAPIEIDANGASTRIGSAIGSNTVAYVDQGLDPSGAGEVIIHDLATSTANRITSDPASDQNPSVSPNGTVVVWEKCVSSALNCDIYQAVLTAGSWTVSAAAASTDPEGNPDSNGSLIVYDSTRAGNADIFWRPVGGGAEVQLQMPSPERNPSIAGNFIAFESRATLKTDLFVYDVANNRLYQITNTPAINESLNDITVLANGQIRLVWASDEDGTNQNNIWGATFALAAPTPAAQIMDLIALVLSFNLQHGIENSLDAKLENILDALNAVGNGNTSTACNKLNAFANEVQAQSGHHITAAQAAQLIAACDAVKATLECP